MAIYSVGVRKMLVFRFDVLDKLKKCGFTTYSLTKEHGMSPATIQKLRNKTTDINAATINRLCGLLHCQPGDLLEYVEDCAAGQSTDR